MVSALPIGLRQLAYQLNGVSLEMITWYAGIVGYADEVISNLSEKHNTRGSSVSPLCAVLSGLWSFVDRLDSRAARLERCLRIGQYIQNMSFYYFNIVLDSPNYRNLRTEATNILLDYEPRSKAERGVLIWISVVIVDAWKAGTVLEQEGLNLLRCQKDRFPEMRQWDTLTAILLKFMGNPLNTAEWEHNWRLGSRL